MQKFFLMISGANTKILERPECQSERSKYAMIGVFIAGTTILSTLSGGYALFTVFRSVELATVLGSGYGLLIANIDRFLVNSTTKEEHISISQSVNVAVRLILAVFIGVVVAKPLELRTFEKTIQAEITLENLKTTTKAEQGLTEKFGEIQVLEQKNQTIQAETNKKEQEKTDTFNSAMAENDGTKGTLAPGKGRVYAEKFALYQKLEAEYQEFKQVNQEVIAKNQKRIAQLKAKKDQEAAIIENTHEAANDLLTQIKILEHLSKQEPAISRASWAIMMLLIALDTAPIIAKTFLKRGIYDEILDVEKKILIDNEQRKLKTMIEMNRANQQFILEQYMASLRLAATHPQQTEVNQEIAEEIVKNSAPQIMDAMHLFRTTVHNSIAHEVDKLKDLSRRISQKFTANGSELN